MQTNAKWEGCRTCIGQLICMSTWPRRVSLLCPTCQKPCLYDITYSKSRCQIEILYGWCSCGNRRIPVLGAGSRVSGTKYTGIEGL